MERKEYTFCRICESLCGLEVTLDGNEVKSIMPDFDHVTTRGFACPKGLKQHKLYSTSDRLKYPLAKKNGKWNRQSWNDSLHEIGDKVKNIQSEYGKNSIAMYVGTAAGFGVLHPIFAQGFMDALGSNNLFSSASQDCSNKFAVSHQMYGYPFTLTFPDLLHTNCLIIVGANPVVSKWSFLQVPNPGMHLKEMQARGCKVYVVDPRKTETARLASEYVSIRPGSDPFFYLSFLKEMVCQDGIRLERLGEHIKNHERIINLAKEWPSSRTKRLTGISTSQISNMVKDFLNADGAVMYSSTGVNMAKHGSISFWVQECINLLSGNVDQQGGALVGKGIIDFPKFGKKNGKLVRPDRSRLHHFQSTNDAFPGGLLADEILSEGKGQIKALFVTGGNPLITMANSNRLRQAFESLELLVTLDIYPNETGSIAHYMLPCTSPLERPDLPFIFPLMLGMQTRPYLQATDAILEARYEERDEATIYLELCKACGVNLFGSSVTQKLLQVLKWGMGVFTRKKYRALPQKFLLNAILRLSGQIGFRKLLSRKHGMLTKPHQVESFIPDRILTSDGKIDLAPQLLMNASKELSAYFADQLATIGAFKLITKRDVTTHNSWTHNINEFTKGDRYSNYAYLNSKDAIRLEVEFKDLVEVKTDVGSIVLPVKISDDIQERTIAVPHGWGHQSSNMEIAKNTTGVNVNILAADGIDHVESVSGMSQLTALDVQVNKYHGELANSWSGLPQDEKSVPSVEYDTVS